MRKQFGKFMTDLDRKAKLEQYIDSIEEVWLEENQLYEMIERIGA